MLTVERKPSHSESVHRRRVLAEERRESPKKEIFDSRESSIRESRSRLINVELELSPTSAGNMPPLKRASLEFEKIWLEFKIGDVSESDRNFRFQRTLNYWETTNSEVFNLLTRENGNGVTPLAEIRDRIIPQVRISGFHTKRV